MQSTIERLALDVGISMSAIHGWRRTGRVAHRHRLALLNAATAAGVDLPPEAFDQVSKLRAGRPRKNHAA